MKMRPPNTHAGIHKEDWEGPGWWRSEKRGKEEGALPAVSRLSDRSRKVAEQQNSSKGLWVTRDERHISAYTAMTENSPVWLVFVIWQAYKDQSCSTQGLFTSQEYQPNFTYWSAFRTSKTLILPNFKVFFFNPNPSLYHSACNKCSNINI